MFSTIAFAQAAAGVPARPSFLESSGPMIVVMIAVFYFLVIRPQQKRQQTQNAFREKLKRGDSVLTTGGILGTIEGLTESMVTLQIANGVKIKVLKSAIAGLFSDSLPTQAEQK
jgi:preprotein translocase subunit YajC